MKLNGVKAKCPCGTFMELDMEAVADSLTNLGYFVIRCPGCERPIQINAQQYAAFEAAGLAAQQQ